MATKLRVDISGRPRAEFEVEGKPKALSAAVNRALTAGAKFVTLTLKGGKERSFVAASITDIWEA